MQWMAQARTWQEVDAALDMANQLSNYHGVEGIEGLDYVNTGETYDLTLLYDRARRTFLLGNWGDWLETYEREHPPEENCTRCGERYPRDELDAEIGHCQRCIEAVNEELAEAEAEQQRGRRFDVWVAHRITDRDGNRHLVRAWWVRAEGLELRVQVNSIYGIVMTVPERLAEHGVLYGARGITWLDSGYRLSTESIERALVEMDLFLEER